MEETKETGAKPGERLAAAGALAGTMAKAGVTALRGLVPGRKQAEGDDGLPEAEVAADGSGVGGRVSRVLHSRAMFRSVVALLVLTAIAQWGLIFFNYWR